ncbi:uroporphyrinogen decarboxylase family protein [Bacteroides nordii]|uniref:uroporphyrinogen decarboxylase family protein n=1 Tax=Bacteroides nordii TaxID=291645 RepID=UPI00399B8227
MKIDMENWIASVIDSSQRIAVPIMTHTGIEMLGHKVIDAVTDGQLHYQAVKILSEKYPSAASSVIMDLTVEAEAFGSQIHFSENEVPSVLGRLVSNRDEIEQLQIPSLEVARVPEYIHANRLIATEAIKPVLSGCIGPYSLAGRLFDMSEIMMAMYIEPDSVKLLLNKCTDFIKRYCTALKQAGANGVLIAEPAAGLLSNEACIEFSSVYVKEIVDEIQDDNFSIILHNCGNTGQCTDAMVYTGAVGYHFGNGIDMVEALEQCPKNALVLGNIDPVSIMKMASPEEVYQQTTLLLTRTAAYSNFVLSTGCDTPPEIPLKNIEMFYNALNDYNLQIK